MLVKVISTQSFGGRWDCVSLLLGEKGPFPAIIVDGETFDVKPTRWRRIVAWVRRLLR